MKSFDLELGSDTFDPAWFNNYFFTFSFHFVSYGRLYFAYDYK
jgi:hypothetical protein